MFRFWLTMRYAISLAVDLCFLQHFPLWGQRRLTCFEAGTAAVHGLVMSGSFRPITMLIPL
jgi:hypothetical protein